MCRLRNQTPHETPSGQTGGIEAGIGDEPGDAETGETPFYGHQQNNKPDDPVKPASKFQNDQETDQFADAESDVYIIFKIYLMKPHHDLGKQAQGKNGRRTKRKHIKAFPAECKMLRIMDIEQILQKTGCDKHAEDN